MFGAIRRWFRRPSDPSGHVYYARLATPQGAFYKLGYTTKMSLVERFAYGGHGDEKLIDEVLLFSFREDAWDVEQTLLDHFDAQRAFGKYSNDPSLPLSGRGQSELFKVDVLGLDEALYRPIELASYSVLKEEAETARNGCLLVIVGLALAPITLGLSLFLILGGGSDILSSKVPDKTGPVRPRHPPKIKALLESLTHQRDATSGA